MIKKCKYCGSEFETKGRSLYCSDACRLTGSAIKPLKKKEEKPKPIYNCEYCGKEFEATYKNKVYYSAKCRNRANQSVYDIPKKTKKPKYTIEEIQRLARAEGLTYGQYIARHGI